MNERWRLHFAVGPRWIFLNLEVTNPGDELSPMICGPVAVLPPGTEFVQDCSGTYEQAWTAIIGLRLLGAHACGERVPVAHHG